MRVVISGRVQGVWFRGSMVREAQRLGAAGWVRNLADGTVEAQVEGPAEAVEQVLAWCRRGPSGARVESVNVTETAEAGLSDFVIEY